MPEQRSLLDILDPPTANTTVPHPTKFHAATWVKKVACIEPFDDWDLSRMIPDPDYVPPEEVRLATDDPEWVPQGRFG